MEVIKEMICQDYAGRTYIVMQTSTLAVGNRGSVAADRKLRCPDLIPEIRVSLKGNVDGEDTYIEVGEERGQVPSIQHITYLSRDSPTLFRGNPIRVEFISAPSQKRETGRVAKKT
jgi:hypothetical protein